MSPTSVTLLHSPASTTSTTSTTPSSLTTKPLAASTTCGTRCTASTHKGCLSSCVDDSKWDRAFWGKSWTEGGSASASASLAGIVEDKKELKVIGNRPREGMMTEEGFKEMETARVEAVRNVKGE